MKTKAKAIVVALVVTLALCSIPSVGADSSEVTVTWVVPADTTIQVSLPANATAITFKPAGMTFTDEPADGQLDGTPALRVVNGGNTALEINGNFSGAFHTNVTYVNFSATHTAGSDIASFSNAEATANTVKQMTASLGIGGTANYYAFSDGTNVEMTSGASQTFTVTSSVA